VALTRDSPSRGRANQLQRVVPLQQAIDKMTQGCWQRHLNLLAEGFGKPAQSAGLQQSFVMRPLSLALVMPV